MCYFEFMPRLLGDIRIFQLKRGRSTWEDKKSSGGGDRRTAHETMSFLWDICFRIYKEISAAIHLFKQYSTVKQHSKVWWDSKVWQRIFRYLPLQWKLKLCGHWNLICHTFHWDCLKLNDLFKCMFVQVKSHQNFHLVKQSAATSLTLGLHHISLRYFCHR